MFTLGVLLGIGAVFAFFWFVIIKKMEECPGTFYKGVPGGRCPSR
jgi:hypothetical protein